MRLPTPPFTGGCQCGACRYRVTGAPVRLYVCHCTECRAQSASAFGISLIVNPEDLQVTRGEPRVWHRSTSSGGHLNCSFCPDCGSRLFHQGNVNTTELSIKGGSLDHPPDLTDAYHIWTRSRLPGVIIPPGAVSYAHEPPD